MPPDPKAKLQLLCVDDEPALLEALTHLLRRRYQVHTAASGQAALMLLQKEPGIAIIVSDMRMPGMNGAEFLAASRKLAPDAVRLLLTGQSNLESAIAAVNEGQIFRFLTKPCPAPLVEVAIDAAALQHRLLTAERVLLEETLRGSVKLLTDVLALTSPLHFGRASRVKQSALELAEALALPEKWQLEVAAMFSQLGLIALPQDVLEKVNAGQPLGEAEGTMVARASALTETLLSNIPRLEEVREILAGAARPPVAGGSMFAARDERSKSRAKAAQILRVANDLDILESQGVPTRMALDTLRGRVDRYDEQVISALVSLRGREHPSRLIREMAVASLRPGMTLAEDMRTTAGALLVSHGFEITESFVERARNFKPGLVREPVRVIVSGSVSTAVLPALR